MYDEPLARHTYHLRTEADGRVTGRAWTNDNLDRGYPSEEADWPVSYPNRESALHQTGGSHRGCNGCVVDVFLDGHLI